jgi:hypothetical protein
MRMIFKTNLFFIFWMDLMDGKKQFQVTFYFLDHSLE